ncbi:TRAP transporter small permease [Paracoccus saliphilus]|uniref:TRAP transporter small permease protein n=1 Tax=Paracoccus saliphilus TaxID=405559 RepID=A0AA45W659_9RHOB|nr:TRAP transporter small permease [Paracoccus saliphilus]WCR01515.1 TRAP transporter small permease [Paracoccus saliphilus]SIS99382.1 TRAP-type C4-dicarboxylate transport system, small permease component [Paracoccus saliphilus]
MPAMQPGRGGFVLFAYHLCKWWAIGGGVILFGIVAVNVVSVVGLAIWRSPIPGVYEIVQIGAAVAMFMMLPYCQITGSNVSADIFTASLRPRTITILAGIGALLGAVFGLFLIWRMGHGLKDVYVYRETTAIYQFPVWIAYVPTLLSLALFVLAAIANMVQTAQGVLPEQVDHDATA